MKLAWCPETASKAFIDAAKMAPDDGEAAELVAAMAGGWKAQLIVEAWERGDGAAASSAALTAAARHTRGRHVCVVPDERAAAEYADAAMTITSGGGNPVELVVGDAEEMMRELEGVDFVVVNWRRRDAGRVVREARPGPLGMVVVCRNAGGGRGDVAAPSAAALAAGRRVVRSVYLPVGRGMEILHVGVGKGPSIAGGGGTGGGTRWICHVDRLTGEEHVFRRR
ncbi:hypothetical protein AXF42_Ash012543 [Apostasia shenzhenica]|uniref:Uncharacterized protein n=1 Tax=Apostasia shenzhenica TaxID=1088818 RepID=A0A2I0AR28_9ASPA|nr:hypothetical protein AXF42_Ash012543 [Apostasia shenzhenica]